MQEQSPPVPSAIEEKKTRLSAKDRRRQIIAAAQEVFIDQGLHGARSRQIADRAGITEAYLYRKFHSKEELYRAAIDEPLEELTDRLRSELKELQQRDGVSRSQMLLHCHELLLTCMVQVAPLIGAALFANQEGETGFYSDYLFPTLRKALVQVIPDITGWPIKAFEVDVFVDAMIGIHITVALEHLLAEEPLDVAAVAEQITRTFAPGVS